MAQFLSSKGFLTDGGQLNLNAGLLGRGGVLSLTTQDVRTWGHGLVLELWESEEPQNWPVLTLEYSQRFDRGKPRRPTRLQRLYLEWSRDLGPLGLLEAAQSHPQLWPEIRDAVAFQSPEDQDRHFLESVLEFREQKDWSRFHERFLSLPRQKGALLKALPLLDGLALKERLDWLAQRLVDEPHLTPEVVLACRASSLAACQLPISIARAVVVLVENSPGETDPKWLGSLRHYRWPRETVSALSSAVSMSDPIRRIVFGARPGTNWFEQLLDDLLVHSYTPETTSFNEEPLP